MDSSYRLSAIVISRQSYRENDSLVLVYAKEAGLLELPAKGTKKPSSKLAGHLEPITLAEIMAVRGRGRDYVASAIGRNSFLGLKADLNKLYYAGQGLKQLRALIRPRQPDPEIFALLLAWLEALDGWPVETGREMSQEDGEIALAFFLLRLLDILGYRPQIETCPHCQKPVLGEGRFDFLAGGLFHPECANKGSGTYRLSQNSLHLIRFCLGQEISRARSIKAGRRLRQEVLGLARGLIAYSL